MPLEVNINVVDAEARRLMRRLGREARSALRGATTRGFARIKQLVLREAKDNAPISPTKGQHEASLKAGWTPRTRGGVKDWGTRKSAIAANARTRVRFGPDGRAILGASTLRSKRTDFTPGSLTKSIEAISDADHAELFVPSNSLAGAYAFYIEEEGPAGAGKWKQRGLGTVAKGGRARDKFMYRAVFEDVGAERMGDILKAELSRAVEGLNR